MLQYLGKISYSTYLTHMIPMYVAMYAADRLGLSPNAYRVFLLVAVPPAIVLVSHLIHVSVEAPCIRFGRRFSTRAIAGQRAREELGRGA
jgi:peptidoglycan/LPS O-acetylase OafA/YrhL